MGGRAEVLLVACIMRINFSLSWHMLNGTSVDREVLPCRNVGIGEKYAVWWDR